MSDKYTFPLGIQIKLPEDYKTNKTFETEMKALKDYGITGVELNIAKPENEKYKDVQSYFDKFGITFTMFASGLTANTFGLSLSTENEDIRKKSVAKIKEIIDFVAWTDTGIILGFFKGPKQDDNKGAIARFSKSLSEFADYAISNKVRILIESTNHYESSVSNSLEDAFNIIKDYDNDYIQMLPDTYHMNIEEVNMFESMEKYKDCYSSFHLSDNNRFFPGFGAINFKTVIDHLNKIGYKGRVAIEGNLKTTFIEDAGISAKYLLKQCE